LIATLCVPCSGISAASISDDGNVSGRSRHLSLQWRCHRPPQRSGGIDVDAVSPLVESNAARGMVPLQFAS
jgi:hypothetical protein